ncbi:MAG: RidA family protein [Deltaproteobacteria bacterium]|nr:MAG: RidA family protein [Deltaproteobacteria bacterium]
MKPISIVSPRAAEPVGRYPHARRVGNLLFVSGIGPRARGTREIPGVTLDAEGNVLTYDIETQCRSMFQNLRYIIEDAGARWEDIVDVTVFLTNMEADFATYNRVYAEHFPGDSPARTTVEVKSLPTPIAVEIKCIVFIEDAGETATKPTEGG